LAHQACQRKQFLRLAPAHSSFAVRGTEFSTMFLTEKVSAVPSFEVDRRDTNQHDFSVVPGSPVASHRNMLTPPLESLSIMEGGPDFWSFAGSPSKKVIEMSGLQPFSEEMWAAVMAPDGHSAFGSNMAISPLLAKLSTGPVVPEIPRDLSEAVTSPSLTPDTPAEGVPSYAQETPPVQSPAVEIAEVASNSKMAGAASPTASSTSKSEEANKSTCGLRRGRRVRRPPGEFNLEDNTSTKAPRRTNSASKGCIARKRSTGKAAGRCNVPSAVSLSGGIRRRPTAAMTVEERVLAIFGEDALRLDRDSFKLWRSATELPTLTSSEQATLKRLRRRLLGRTYAKRSRDRQVAHAESVQTACEKLASENAAIRKKIERLEQLLSDDTMASSILES